MDSVFDPTAGYAGGAADLVALPPLDDEVDFADCLNSLMESGAGPSTNKDLAAAMRLQPGMGHVDASWIWRLRNGQRSDPRLHVLRALCAIYEVPPAWWFSGVVRDAVEASRSQSDEL